MKHLFILLIFFFGYPMAYSQSGADDEVLAVEKSRFQAMVKKDFDQLDKLIGEDLYYLHSNGAVDTKESFINAIKEGKSYYDEITIEQAKTRKYGNTAIINGECTYHRKNQDGSPNNTQLRYTSVYVKQKGQWRLVSWQSFKIS